MSALPTSLPEQLIVNVGPIVGVQFAALFISAVLWGMQIVQTFIYYTHFQKDKLTPRVVVSAMMLVSTIHVVALFVGIYQTVFERFGDIINVYRPLNWTTFSQLCTIVLVALMQAFFLARIVKFSLRRNSPVKRWHLWAFLAITIPLTLWYIIAYLWYIVLTANASSYEAFAQTIPSVLGKTIYIVIAINDTFLAAAMALLLHWSKTGSKRTDRLLTRIMLLVLNSGIWTSIWSWITLILVFAFPGTVDNAVLCLSTAGLYANTILGNLNAREAIDKDRHESAITSLPAIDHSRGSSNRILHQSEGSQTDVASSTKEGSNGVFITKSTSSYHV